MFLVKYFLSLICLFFGFFVELIRLFSQCLVVCVWVVSIVDLRVSWLGSISMSLNYNGLLMCFESNRYLLSYFWRPMLFSAVFFARPIPSVRLSVCDKSEHCENGER